MRWTATPTDQSIDVTNKRNAAIETVELASDISFCFAMPNRRITLYSSTKDHINEFATLRALGSSSGYIHQVILTQAGLSAVIGYILGMILALLVVLASQASPLPIIMTPQLAVGLFSVTLFMCAISAISAIVKVTKIDPATVFSR